MPVIAYQCKSCGAELAFQADKGAFVCEYCGSSYTKEELESTEKTTTQQDVERENTQPEEESAGEALLYHCPNCGGEVITDETTAATQCYYCHSPVVLSGRLSGKYLPKYVIPFKFSREAAIEKFDQWTKSKWFLPKDFYNQDQIDALTGIYFPYWIIDSDSDVSYTATCETLHTWVSGDHRHTRHKVYHCVREGQVHLEDLVKSALNKASKKLIENVQPFDESAMEKFSMTYLSGFQAERRDIEAEDIKSEVLQDIQLYCKKTVEGTVTGYQSKRETGFRCNPTSIGWDYGLLPVWALTYTYREQVYYFAMNGQTGKVCGKLPVDQPKLIGVAALVSVASLILGLLGGFML